MINMDLAEERGLSDEAIQKIETLQEERSDLLENPERHAATPALAQERLTSIEYSLQSLWGFPLDSEYHTMATEMKGCGCDYVTRSIIIRVNPFCPYHGMDNAETWDDERFK